MKSRLDTPLTLTGERTIPGIERENYWFRRHEAVYEWVAARQSPDTRGVILEAGSGEGYGAALLQSRLRRPTVALDYDDAACHHASTTYGGLPVVRANLAQLPIAPQSAGLAVSLQVIEHLWDVRSFLTQLHDAVIPGGSIVISTPNRITFSPGVARGQKPLNPFHVEEFDREQLLDLLHGAGCADVEVFGLIHAGALVHDERVNGSIVDAQIAAIMSDAWNDDLTRRVAAITTSDFAIVNADDECFDLIAVGVRA